MTYKLVFYTAPWCGACKMVYPVIANLSTIKGTPLEIVDTDEQPARTAGASIMSLPTLILLQDGVEVYRKEGAVKLKTYLEDLAGFQ